MIVHHFVHLLEGLGLAVGAVGSVIGWFLHMTWGRVRFGKRSKAS